MIKNTLIIALVIVIIYLYYQQNKKPNLLTGDGSELAEIKTKLGKKTLDELLAENEDYETEVDTLTRTKNSLEQDLAVQATAFQARLREKDREIKKFKADLASEKQQHKGSLGRINKLTEQLTNLEKSKRSSSPMPGQFPTLDELTNEHQAQLRKLYSLFDLRARGFKAIDFNQLYTLLQKVSKKVDIAKIDK
jgi:chromosome segregation ATPase